MVAKDEEMKEVLEQTLNDLKARFELKRKVRKSFFMA